MGIRCADHVTTLYPQKLALTSLIGGGRSVGIVRSRTKATESEDGVQRGMSGPHEVEVTRGRKNMFIRGCSLWFIVIQQHYDDEIDDGRGMQEAWETRNA